MVAQKGCARYCRGRDKIPATVRVHGPAARRHRAAREERREPIFLDDEGRSRFIDLLAQAVRQQGALLQAFCLMGNHYHRVVETPEPIPARNMRRSNGVYTL